MAAVQYPWEQGPAYRAAATTSSALTEASGRERGSDALDQRRPPLLALALVITLVVGGWPAADVVTGLLAGPPAGGAVVEGGDGGEGSAAAIAPADRFPAGGAVSAVGAVPVHRVRPGETYWSIAGRLDAGGDRRAVVDALMEANGGQPLHPGDRLPLPLPPPSRS